MREITIAMSVRVSITDEEYQKLKNSACDPRADDCSYHDIIAPSWLINRAMEEGKIVGGGMIPSTVWYNRQPPQAPRLSYSKRPTDWRL